ncbi:MAG: hypothetical protein AAGF12_17765 [Myxococcota bacterium]
MVEAEEREEPVDPLSRPLPSVDMRLLRDERRSLRFRLAVGAGAAFFLGGSALAAVLLSG